MRSFGVLYQLFLPAPSANADWMQGFSLLGVLHVAVHNQKQADRCLDAAQLVLIVSTSEDGCPLWSFLILIDYFNSSNIALTDGAFLVSFLMLRS